MAAPGTISVFLVCTLFVSVQSWSGNVCTIQKVTYNSRSECRENFFGWCLHWESITFPIYYMDSTCCPGWRDNGNQNCNIPICTPACQNGGTCIAPNKCQCQVQNTGQFCDGSVCSHLSPCYPGRCIAPNSCDCTSGFATTSVLFEGCLTIEDNRKTDIKIYQMQVRMSYWQRGARSPSESYYIMADSTQRTEMDFFWSNQKDFNRLETSCSSQFIMPDLPLKPNYIGNAGFGVVSGRVEVWLSKRPVYPSQPRFSSLNNTFSCVQQASSTQPVSGIYQCNLFLTDFDRLLEHGDFLKVTFRIEGGGFRELLNLNYYYTPLRYAVQTYRTINNSLSVEFRFDFKPPYHCEETSSCRSGENILEVPDITRVAPLKISWKGWADDDSKVYRYSLEVFKMTKTIDNKLEIRVDEALLPLINREVFEARYTTQEYTPPAPGMYSIILEAGDKANNTKYVRRLCLYDPSSQITLDPNFRLYVTSASNVANYSYQSSLTTPVSVNWTNYFRNAFHEDNALLGEVLAYPTQLENGKKNIPRNGPLDDHQGRRTVNAILNRRGIINFKVAFTKDHDGGQTQPLAPTTPLSGWIDLGLSTTYTLPSELRPSEADTVTIWVKATDSMGNERIDYTQATFDTTPPVAQGLKFYMNVPVPGVDFSSVFDLTVRDKESGVAYVLWTFRRSSGVILHQEKMPGKIVDEKVSNIDC